MIWRKKEKKKGAQKRGKGKKIRNDEENEREGFKTFTSKTPKNGREREREEEMITLYRPTERIPARF